MFLIRNPKMSDLPDLLSLAKLVNMTNLPHHKESLELMLNQACSSFNGQIEKPFERLYLFVLEDLEKKQVIGTSQIIPCHGSKSYPHSFFQVQEDSYYSESLSEKHQHKILKLGFDTEGYTELAGLILDPGYRHVPQKLGRALGVLRFKFIQDNPELFKERLLSELLPRIVESGEPHLWRAIGSRFVDMTFKEADVISRTQNEFIRALFPKHPIYLSMLPEEVQESLGHVGENTKPAKHLLESLGFSYQNRVDPFDAGPHFEMFTKDLPAINLPWKYEFKNKFTLGANFRVELV